MKLLLFLVQVAAMAGAEAGSMFFMYEPKMPDVK